MGPAEKNGVPGVWVCMSTCGVLEVGMPWGQAAAPPAASVLLRGTEHARLLPAPKSGHDRIVNT